jgi:hypothetical protein
MNRLISALDHVAAPIRRLAVAGIVASCAVPAFAQQAPQPAAPLTHAQVMQELYQLESVGYDPTSNNYPDDIEAAEQRLAQKQAAQQMAEGDHGVAAQASNARQ